MASTPPREPQMRQKCDWSDWPGSGSKVAYAIAARLVIVRTSPNLRRCGVEATVIGVLGNQDVGPEVRQVGFPLVAQGDSAR